MRQLSPAMQAAITARCIVPAWMAQITFQSSTEYVWTGVGNITFNGNTFKGVGSVGSIGTISETTGVEAKGTTVGLSGVDPTLYAECVSEIVTGLPAMIWFGCLSGNVVVDAILLFSGLVDMPTIDENSDAIDISIALEHPITNLQRANRLLYTAAEQHRKYPTDSGFNYTPIMVDVANVWG